MTNADVVAAANQLFPGGVNSPVRSFRSVGGQPIAIERGNGPHVWDADGTRYIDYIGAFGPMIAGHAHPRVVEAVAKAAANGFAFGALSPLEVELGQRVVDATGQERVRFVSSGTEATMTAIRIARAATGRDVVVKFDGCYHGHSDGLLAKAGSGVATLGLSASAGVPEAIAGKTAVLPFNDVDALRTWFDARANETAAVIVEPLPANMGLVPPSPEFAEALQDLCEAHGAVLIADEVICGFRLKYGLSELLPRAGLACLGKIIGGGLPIGAIAGKRDLMDQLAPAGAVYQAGTLSGNPVAMAAGCATLDIVREGDAYERLERVGAFLENGLRAAIRRADVKASVARRGSLLTLFFREQPPTDFAEAQESDTNAFATFHRAMLERGILLPPSQYEAWFVSLAHNEAEIDETVRAAHEALHVVAGATSQRNGQGQ